MFVDDLPPAEELWWRAVCCAALGLAGGDDGWSLDDDLVLAHDGPGGHRFRLQRLYGTRLVLWGSVPGGSGAPVTGVPGWTNSDAVRQWVRRSNVGLIAWAAHGEWDTATPTADPAPIVAPAMTPLPEDFLERAMAGVVTEADLRDQLDETPTDDEHLATALDLLSRAGQSGRPARGQLRTLLTREIHAQMRLAEERPRLLPQRPAQLVRWTRVATPGEGFVFTARAERGRIVAHRHGGLGEQFRGSLERVLQELWREESDPESGAWLFARVRFHQGRTDFDRVFDSWPTWYAGEPHSIPELEWEMAQRSADWRPRWTRLLPGLRA